MAKFVMVEIAIEFLFGIVYSGMLGLFVQQRLTWAKLCKLARVVKKNHPKEAAEVGL